MNLFLYLCRCSPYLTHRKRPAFAGLQVDMDHALCVGVLQDIFAILLILLLFLP